MTEENAWKLSGHAVISEGGRFHGLIGSGLSSLSEGSVFLNLNGLDDYDPVRTSLQR